jgi:DNA-binding GntR family transcriptional regulator
MAAVASHLPGVTSLPRDPQHVDVVYAAVRDAILRGTLAPGEEVRQEHVARELEVSRTPLREALRMLEREGLVHAERNRSYRVAGISASDAEQIYVMRIPLEAAAIRISIPRLDTADIATLEGELAQMATFADRHAYEHWEVPHRAFHRGLVARAGERVSSFLSVLSDHAERYRRFYTTELPGAWSVGVAEHRAILDACSAGDTGRGAAELVGHLHHVAISVIAAIDPGHDPRALSLAVDMARAPIGAER